MKYYYIYQILFPAALAVVSLPILFAALCGLFRGRPVVFSSKFGTLVTGIILVPVFFLALNHLIVMPAPDTWRAWLLNVFGVVGSPLVLLWSWCWSRGYTVIGVDKATLLNDLKAKTEGGESFHAYALPCTHYVIVRVPSSSPQSPEQVGELLYRHYRALPSRVSARPFFVMLVLGIALASTGFGTWCFATQCGWAGGWL